MYILIFYGLVPCRIFWEKTQLINIPAWDENITKCNSEQDQSKHYASAN